VVGAGRSGKSTCLAGLARAAYGTPVDRVRRDLAFVWDALVRVGRADAPAGVLLIDDVDALIASCPDEWSSALVDLLGRALREGPARGVHVVLTAQRVSGAMHALAALCGSVLLLRMPSRQEHLLAGGDPDSWTPGLPPGGGVWRGDRVQVVLPEGQGDAVADTAGDRPDEHPLVLHGCGPLVVVAARPREFAERVRELDPRRAIHSLDKAGVDPHSLVVGTGETAVCIVGDPAAWQAQWGLLAALRPHATVLFDGCGVSDLRNLGIRELPPPPLRGARALWVLILGEEPRRARLLRFTDQTVDSADFTHV
jgi:S-DNA-T family DNA segregation ATPase FtsK/SpoIIIE